MKNITIYSLLTLSLAAQSAMALSVTEAEVANKVRVVSLQQVQHENQPATVLADAKGISLYTFDSDSEGKSVCTGSCLTVWPPLVVVEGETLVEPFGAIMGNNGKPQLTLKGLPLYYYKKDKVPGDVFGHYPGWQLVLVIK